MYSEKREGIAKIDVKDASEKIQVRDTAIYVAIHYTGHKRNYPPGNLHASHV